MTAEASIQDAWLAAFQRTLAKLSSEDRAIMLNIPTYGDLRDYMENLQQSTSTRLVTRFLARIQGLLLNLKAFTEVIDVAIQSNPSIAALIWGGLKLVLEVSSCFMHRICPRDSI